MIFGAFPWGAMTAGVLILFPLVRKAQSFSENAAQGVPSKEKNSVLWRMRSWIDEED